MVLSYFNINGVPSKLYRTENPYATVLVIHGFDGNKDNGDAFSFSPMKYPFFLLQCHNLFLYFLHKLCIAIDKIFVISYN